MARLTQAEILQIASRYREIVDDWEAFIEALFRPLPRVIWLNPLKISSEAFQSLLREEGVSFEPVRWSPGAFRLKGEIDLNRTWWYQAGLAHAQEEASLLPVKLLDPKPGERILDLCAAPGGKTAQIAIALENRHTVVANDINWQRLRSLRSNIERLGLFNVSITMQDGASYPNAAGLFDRVLVDVPCSCEGTLRRQEADHLPFGAGISRRYARKQLAILKRAVVLCRPGGRIVYSTCTFAPEENEGVISAILEAFEGFLRVAPVEVPGLKLTPGISEWRQERFHPEVRHTVRLWPHHNDTGGFFVAVLEKSPTVPILPFETAQISAVEVPEVEMWLLHWHGISKKAFSELIPHRRTGRGLHFVHGDHRPPKRPEPKLTGLILLRTATKPPKISTEGAKLLGHLAKRQVVDLRQEQLDLYLTRQTFPLSETQRQGLEDGYVIVRYRGFGLGTGRYLAGQGMLESLYPKGL